MPPIALLSDLGEKDYFVGAMKGVILSINPEVAIVDISHQIPKHDIRTAAFVLANAAEPFPKGSIFLTVVDPGVGTERICILLQTQNGLNFIGPDNGVFALVASCFGIREIREVSNKELMRSEVSATFHGRDLMSPVAAHLSLGLNPSEVGPRIERMKRLKIEEPELEADKLHGRILHIDDFGNLITNIDAGLMKKFESPGSRLTIETREKVIGAKFVRAFGDVKQGEKLCYIGSAGLLEIAKNTGNLAEELEANSEDKIILKRALKRKNCDVER